MDQQTQNGITEDPLMRLLIYRYGKPLIKQALDEFLKENGLMIVPTKPLANDDLLSTKQVIKFLGGITRQTLYKYIQEEGLPTLTVGNSFKFRMIDVQNFLQEKKKYRAR